MSDTNGAAAPAEGSDRDRLPEQREGENEEGFARRLGWRPEEEWKGPESKKPREFLPAKEYIDQTLSAVPAMRERIRRYDQTVDQQGRQITDLNSKIADQGQLLRELLDRSRGAEKAGYERARRELEAQKREAVTAADPAAYDRADAQLQALEKQHAEVAKPVDPPADTRAPPARQEQQPPQVAPEVAEFVRENPWFNTDKVLHVAAVDTLDQVDKEMPGASLAERLAETKRRVEEEFPQRFGRNPRRDAPSTVNPPSGGNGGRQPKKKTVADLPAEAKAELARFKNLIKGFTDEEYLADYQW